MATTGKCLCGAVHFSADEIASELHACHCSMCRRWAGGPTLCLEAKGVRFEGAEHISRYQSSAWAERGFCRQCGSSLFYRLKEKDQYIMCMGAFDDVERFVLAGEIYIDDKPACYAFAGDHPRMTGDEFMASLQQTS